jgi:hypothetical protein
MCDHVIRRRRRCPQNEPDTPQTAHQVQVRVNLDRTRPYDEGTQITSRSKNTP